MAESLLNEASDDIERARLLAARTRSGAWLHAFPVSSLGLRLDYSSLRMAVRLRLGITICAPHFCRHCDAEVPSRGLHGLSCKSSEGRHVKTCSHQ